MNMNLVLFKITLILASILCAISPLRANNDTQDSLSVYNDSLLRIEPVQNMQYIKRLQHYKQAWNNLIPAYLKIQYAGNMGMFSIGTGWQYGKNKQWETDIFFGFIPKHQSKKAKLTFTLKQNFIPWKTYETKRFHFEPLSCGIYFNSVFSDEFWSNAPDKYPNGYYWFSTKVRTNIFIGQRITLKIPHNRRKFARSITFFYEISTHDFAIIQAVKNSRLTPKDYISLSFGTKFQWL